MTIDFSDLIPEKPQASGLSFEDLIPAKPAEAPPADTYNEFGAVPMNAAAAAAEPQSPAAAYVNAPLRGALAGTGGAIAGVGEMYRAGTGGSAQKVLKALDLVDEGRNRDAYQALDQTERGQVAAYRGGSPEDRAGLRDMLRQSVDDYGKPNMAMRAGTAIEHAADQAFPVAPENEGLATRSLGLVGGILPAAAAGLALGPGGAAAVIAPQSYHATMQDALAHGATQEAAEEAAGKSAVLQTLTMSLPVGALLRVPVGLRDGLAKTLVNLGQNGIEFSSMNAAGTFANNYVAQQTYDPERALMQGTGDAALEGAVASLVIRGGAMAVRGGIAAARDTARDVSTIMSAPDVGAAIEIATKASSTPPDPAGETTSSMGWSDLFQAGETRAGETAGETTRAPGEETSVPGAETVPAGGSVGAALAREGTPEAELATPKDEAAAIRYQGEVERLAASPKAGDTAVYINNVKSTLAEHTGNPVDAMDQAYNRQQPEAMTHHIARENETADLVAQEAADVAGSRPALLRLEKDRDARAKANIKEVFGEPDTIRPEADTSKTIQIVEDTLDNPRQAERDSVIKILTTLGKKFYNADGTAKSDPYQLYGIGEHINDLMNGVGDTETNSAARVLKRELMQIRESLYSDIEDAVPGFEKYRAEYQRDSGQIDAMRMLQDARLSLLNKDLHITPAKWFGFMRDIVESRADPMEPAANLSEDQMERLWNITDQLKRSTFLDAGRPRGSWTSMMQEWGGRFARVAAHALILPYAPVVGNLGIEMGISALRRRSVTKEMDRVLNPPPGQPEIGAEPGVSRTAAPIPPVNDTGGPAGGGVSPLPSRPLAPGGGGAAGPAARPPPVNDTGSPPGRVTAGQVQRRDGVGAIEAQRRADSENAALAAAGASTNAAGERPQKVYTPGGAAHDTVYRVVDVRDLRTSHDLDGRVVPDYDADLQPRDRTRAYSQGQVQKIGADPHGEELTQSANTATGAPVLHSDSPDVLSGNGRAMGAQLAYQLGNGAAIRQAIVDAGFDVGGTRPNGRPIQQPILTRQIDAPMTRDERVKFARDAGASPTADISAPERAAGDARAIPTDTLSLLRKGDVGAPGNSAFARAFAEHVLPDSDRGSFMDADGDLSVEGGNRLRNALAQRAYKSNDLVRSLGEDADPDLKAFGGALMDSVGPMAKLRGALETGTVPSNYDIAPALIDAAGLIKTSRRGKFSLANAADQGTMLDPHAGLTNLILTMAFGDNLAGRMNRTKLTAMLVDYAENAQMQSDMFGANKPADELLGEARARYGSAKTGTTGSSVGAAGGNGASLNFNRSAVRGYGGDAAGQAGAGGAAGGDAGQAGEGRAPRQVTPAEPPSGLINATEDPHADIHAWRDGDPLPADIQAAHDRAIELAKNPTIDMPDREEIRATATDNVYEKRLAEIGGEPAREKRAVIITGPPAAGKSSLADPIARDMRALQVDADDFKEQLPEFGQGKRRGEGAGQVHEESSLLAKGMLDDEIGNGTNLVLPIVANSPGKVVKMVAELRAAGYHVELVHNDLPLAKAAVRNMLRYRATGRYVDNNYVMGLGDRPMENHIQGRAVADEYGSYSNDVPRGSAPLLIESSPGHKPVGAP